jgi:hypothetical protein
MKGAEEGPGYTSIILIFLVGADKGPGCANIFYFSSMLVFNTERRKTRGDGSEVVIFAVLADSGMGRGRTTEYTECQAFSAVVRIGSPRPLTRKRVLPPSLVPRGGHTHLRERELGEPIRKKGQTFRTVIHLV